MTEAVAKIGACLLKFSLNPIIVPRFLASELKGDRSLPKSQRGTGLAPPASFNLRSANNASSSSLCYPKVADTEIKPI
jgi:hypothetical protein